MGNAGFTPTSDFTVGELNNNRSYQLAITAGLVNYMDWIIAEELPNTWARQWQSLAEKRTQAWGWVQRLVDAQDNDDDSIVIQLDNDPGVS